MQRPIPLSKAQASRFSKAMALLKSGHHAQASSIADIMVKESPRAADAWQLLGMCLGEIGSQAQSVEAFERALALAPGSQMVSRNYGAYLARHGKALRMQGQFEAAEPALRKALALSPVQASAWVDLGAVLRLLGRVDEALYAFRQAEGLLRQRGISSPEVLDAINGVLADAGCPAEALTGARELVALHPDHAQAHETLSNLLWENGEALAEGEDPLGGFRAAADAQPKNHSLQLAFVRTLLATKCAEEALSRLHPLRRGDPDNPVLDWFAADALGALRQFDQATLMYEAAARRGLDELPEFLNARARHAFRTGRFDLAARCAENVVALDPRNQEGWSHLGTAWRLAGDEREHWLCDYERLVGVVEVVPPPGFDDMSTFLQALGATLDTLHNAKHQPINQSVRGGTQTAGQLFGRNHAVVRSASAALRSAVEAWLPAIPQDPGHPFLAYRQRSVRFVGSWSVRLRSSGSHSNHIHPLGWMSSAFYVALPDNIRAPTGDSREGWLQFGQPLEELGLDLPPRRVIRPKPGHLAVFPSYMWHGTIPFEASQTRLTVAFDMQPSA